MKGKRRRACKTGAAFSVFFMNMQLSPRRHFKSGASTSSATQAGKFAALNCIQLNIIFCFHDGRHFEEGPMKSNRLLRRGPALALLVSGIFAASILRVHAQAKGTVENFTATAVNVTGAPDPVKIDLLRWSFGANEE